MRRRAFIAGMAAGPFCLAMARVATAQTPTLQVYSAGAVKAALEDILPEAERRTGIRLDVTYDVVGALAKRIEGGDVPDLVVLTAHALAELQAAGRLVPATPIRPLASVGVGVAIREGAARPDIGSTDAFRRALLAAKSVVYADPARGASSGIHVASVLKRLGIDAEMAPKTVLRPGGYVVEAVAAGEAELGLHQVSEILPVHGVTLLGPLPAELQRITPYAAAVGRTEQPERAAAVLAFITGPDVHPILRAKGLEPAS